MNWNGFDAVGSSGILIDAAIKGAFVLAAVEIIFLAWRRASAATRHAIRFASVATVLLLPALTSIVPPAAQSVWLMQLQRLNGNEFTVSVQFPAASQKHTAGQIDHPLSTPPTNSSEMPARTIVVSTHACRILAAIWLCGFCATSIPILYAAVTRRRLLRDASMIAGEDWRDAFNAARERFYIARSIHLLESLSVAVPVTWRTFQPVIVIPVSGNEWSAERKRVVLLHELAHVRRCDFLTQTIAQIACALFWFNPLIWRVAAAMRIDREQACDDFVLQSGCKPSDYATHLVEIAANLHAESLGGAIAIARHSGLETRVTLALDATRSRRIPGRVARLTIISIAAALGIALAAQTPERSSKLNRVRERQIAQLQNFSAQKEAQAEALAAKNGERIIPEFQKFFAAAKSGEWQSVTNMYADFHRRHPQYSENGDLPHTTYWSTILEICLAYYDVVWGEPDHVQRAIDGFMKSISRHAIYFGGTDPGRGLPTAFSKNHATADPFFTLTQNALADNSYLQYLSATYGGRIYIPSTNDSATAFADYVKDVTARFDAGKLKHGENVRKNPDGSTGVSGQVAVMEINARLAKIIFDKNPDREFYIEESFPLEWMYPYLSPAGQVMKINHAPLDEIPEREVKKDFAFWNGRIRTLLGARIAFENSTGSFLRDVEAIYVTRTKKVNPRYLQNDWSQRAFSKWRSGIAGVYAWRAIQKPNARMSGAAEAAFRQAYTLCPKSPEVVYRYVNFLAAQSRTVEAKQIVALSRQVASDDKRLQETLSNLEKSLK